MAPKVSERVRVQIDVENFHECKRNVVTKTLDSEVAKLKVNIYPNPSSMKDLKVNVYGKSSTQGEYFIKMSLMINAKSKKIPVGEEELKVAANIAWKKIASFEIQEDLNKSHRHVIGNRNVLTLLLTAGVVDLGLLMEERTTSTKIFSDIKNLMGNQDSCDAVLRSREGHEFPVHMCVVWARAPFLARKFETDMLDMTTLVLKEMVFYFYTGKIGTMDEDVLRDLGMAAGKYSLSELRRMVKRPFLKSVTLWSIAAIAYSRRDLDLLNRTLSYMIKEKVIEPRYLSCSPLHPVLLKYVDYIKRYNSP